MLKSPATYIRTAPCLRRACAWCWIFLLGMMKSHAGLQAERADLQPFADRQPENGIRAEAHRVSGCLLSF